MTHARKTVRKTKVRIMSDANQHVREHNALRRHKQEMEAKRRAAFMERYMKMLEANKAEEAPASVPTVTEVEPTPTEEA